MNTGSDSESSSSEEETPWWSKIPKGEPFPAVSADSTGMTLDDIEEDTLLWCRFLDGKKKQPFGLWARYT